MNKPHPDVKVAEKQSDFATDKNVDREVVDLVLEHDPTKPPNARTKPEKSALDRADDDTLDEEALPDKE